MRTPPPDDALDHLLRLVPVGAAILFAAILGLIEL